MTNKEILLEIENIDKEIKKFKKILKFQQETYYTIDPNYSQIVLEKQKEADKPFKTKIAELIRKRKRLENKLQKLAIEENERI